MVEALCCRRRDRAAAGQDRHRDGVAPSFHICPYSIGCRGGLRLLLLSRGALDAGGGDARKGEGDDMQPSGHGAARSKWGYPLWRRTQARDGGGTLHVGDGVAS